MYWVFCICVFANINVWKMNPCRPILSCQVNSEGLICGFRVGAGIGLRLGLG